MTDETEATDTDMNLLDLNLFCMYSVFLTNFTMMDNLSILFYFKGGTRGQNTHQKDFPLLLVCSTCEMLQI